MNSPAWVFLSYRQAEGGTWIARRIADELTTYLGPGAIFRDTSSIPVAHEWSQAIRQALLQCAACVVLIHPGWLQPRLHDPEDWIRREISTALQRKLAIFPVLVDGARMPSPKDLPDDLQPLAGIEAAFIESRSDASLAATTEILAKSIMSQLQAEVVFEHQRPALGARGTCRYTLRVNNEPLVTLEGFGSRAIGLTPSGVHVLSIAWAEDENRPIYVQRHQGPGHFSVGETAKSFSLRPGVHTFTLHELPDNRPFWAKVKDALLVGDRSPREIVEVSFVPK